MSSLIRKLQAQQVVYVVQSGVVTWEGPEPIADWTAKTVTVCAADAALLSALLKEVLSAEFVGRRSIFRCHLSVIPPSQNALQRRHLSKALHADPPGFAGTLIKFGENVAVSVAELACVNDIELGYLSAYRQTCLIATEEVGITPAAISEVLETVLPPLDGKAISDIRAKRRTFAVLRILEDENQFVFQIMCDPVTSESVVKVMDETGVRRAADRVAASQAIGAILGGRS